MLLKDHLIAHYKMNEDTVGDSADLVTNGNIETGDPPSSWSFYNATIAADADAHGGTQSLEVTAIFSSGFAFQDFDIEEGRVYKFNFWHKYTGSGSFQVATLYDLSNSQQIWNSGGIHDTSWIEKTKFFTTPAGCIRIRVQLITVLNGDICLWDDISLKLCAVEDSSGNDHDGLLQKDTDAAHVDGKINGAFDFDGISDYIEIADHGDFTTMKSISVWVYMHSAVSFFIVSKGVPATDGEWYFGVRSDKKVRFLRWDENINAYIARYYNTALTEYQTGGAKAGWIHLVATSDGGTLVTGLKIYLNGNQVDDTSSTGGTFAAVQNLDHAVWIGRHDTFYANGLIDNMMFFNKELTPNEVKALYNSGRGRETIPIGIENQLSRTGQRFSSHQEM